MKVKNLRASESYHQLKKLVDTGVFGSTVIPPMKWSFELNLGSKADAEQFVKDLDEIFGKSANIYDWPNNYDAPWFYHYRKMLLSYKGIDQYHIYVNLTTDEQLSYAQLAFGHIKLR